MEGSPGRQRRRASTNQRHAYTLITHRPVAVVPRRCVVINAASQAGMLPALPSQAHRGPQPETASDATSCNGSDASPVCSAAPEPSPGAKIFPDSHSTFPRPFTDSANRWPNFTRCAAYSRYAHDLLHPFAGESTCSAIRSASEGAPYPLLGTQP